VIAMPTKPTQEILVPADLPLILATTAVRADLAHSERDRFLLDLHSPTRDLRLHFPDQFVLLACRRAIAAMDDDARRLNPEHIASRLSTLDHDDYRLWNLSGGSVGPRSAKRLISSRPHR
jgi:hypothetical protein